MKNPLTNTAGLILLVGSFILMFMHRCTWEQAAPLLIIAAGFFASKDHNTVGK